MLRAEFKEDIRALRSELKGEMSALRLETQTMKADLVRWVFVAIMGQTAMLLGVLYFFMKFVK